MAEQGMSDDGIELGITEFEGVRVARTKLNRSADAVFVGEARCCANKMRASVDSGDLTGERWSASYSARCDPCTTAQIENRSGRIDSHGIEVLPHHVSEARMFATRLQPCHQDVQSGVIELVGDPVYVNRSHGSSLVVER